jgi:hypothetical protein
LDVALAETGRAWQLSRVLLALSDLDQGPDAEFLR